MNSISPSEEPQLQQIDLTTLNIPQLRQLKQQVDQELNICQDSLQKLKFAQQKFVASNESISELTPECNGKSILVPLTSSMYVPGKLSNPDNFLIDIGTGYFVEKNAEDSKEYFKKKIEFITEQLEKIQIVLIKKSKVREAIMEVMEMKMQPQETAAQS